MYQALNKKRLAYVDRTKYLIYYSIYFGAYRIDLSRILKNLLAKIFLAEFNQNTKFIDAESSLINRSIHRQKVISSCSRKKALPVDRLDLL